MPGDPEGMEGEEEGEGAAAGGVTPSPLGPSAPWSRGQEEAITASLSRSVVR